MILESQRMLKPTTKDYAEYFRLSLEAGLCREDEIESWAYKMIIETNPPVPNWLLSLSTDGEISKNKLLQSVPGEADQNVTWSLLLARLSTAYRAKHFSRIQIVEVIFRWISAGVIPSQFLQGAAKLDQSLDGMIDGWGSEDQFIKDFEDFLVPFRSFQSLLP